MSVVSKLKEVARNETDEAPEEWQDNVTGFERQYKVGIIGKVPLNIITCLSLSFHLQTLEESSQPDDTEDYYCAQNEDNEDKNRYSQILPSKQQADFILRPDH